MGARLDQLRQRARIADFAHCAVIVSYFLGRRNVVGVWDNHDMPAFPMDQSDSHDPAQVERMTRYWLVKAVIGLNLCPFAKAVERKNQIRYVVSSADSTNDLARELAGELRLLHATDPALIDTTLLIHPYVLTDFVEYNAFLSAADKLLRKAGLEGELQIASFHPLYVFAGADSEAIENYTNRSPYPMLHLLREASVERAVDAFPEADAIFERNIATLQALGIEGWQRLVSDPGQVPCEPASP